MEISELLLERSIYEVNFVYNDKMEGYTNSSSDIPELSEITDHWQPDSVGISSMKCNDTSHFPMRARSHATEQASLVVLQDQLPDDWIVRIDRIDYGIDGEIEVVGKNRLIAGNIVKFQIKGHRKLPFRAQNVVQRVNVSSINYWLEIPLPVILFVVDVGQRIVYWIDVKNYIRDKLSLVRPDWRQQKTTQIEIPTRNQLPTSLERITQLALSHKEQLKAYQVALQELGRAANQRNIRVGADIILNEYAQNVMAQRKAEEEMDAADFVGYHIFILLFNGDVDAWEKHLRENGSVEQLINDLPFIIWLKQQLQEDKDLINRIRNAVDG